MYLFIYLKIYIYFIQFYPNQKSGRARSFWVPVVWFGWELGEWLIWASCVVRSRRLLPHKLNTLKSSLRFSLSSHFTSPSLLIIRFSFSTHSHRGRAERGGERNKAFKSPVPRVPALHTLVCVMSVTFVILCVCVCRGEACDHVYWQFPPPSSLSSSLGEKESNERFTGCELMAPLHPPSHIHTLNLSSWRPHHWFNVTYLTLAFPHFHRPCVPPETSHIHTQ